MSRTIRAPSPSVLCTGYTCRSFAYHRLSDFEHSSPNAALQPPDIVGARSKATELKSYLLRGLAFCNTHSKRVSVAALSADCASATASSQPPFASSSLRSCTPLAAILTGYSPSDPACPVVMKRSSFSHSACAKNEFRSISPIRDFALVDGGICGTAGSPAIGCGRN